MFLRLKNSPKAWMIISLILVALFALPKKDFLRGILWLLVSLLVAMIADVFLRLLKNKEIIFPSSAIITGLIVAEVLDYHQSLWILVLAVTLAIFSKHILIVKKRHIFNPANFGLLLSGFFFKGIISWWAGVPAILIIILGFFIAFKMRWLSLIFVFLGLHLLFLGLSALFLQRFFTPQLTLLNFYFAFFMLVEPKTSPQNARARLIYGILTAILVFLLFSLVPQYDSHILALAFANLFVPLVNKLTL
ncbi:MAG: RnfABCDGE type electron transport complex subunit D [Candidatus Omnitrophica bacterium]|nr:RnfABCDGE type electron transport complex subunit D [Candidatus Omnitrophota bacterium]MCM8793024.1 RnfABCDGE type electron transport complex subunit D [Candidatus Omnitrophota bacterium]